MVFRLRALLVLAVGSALAGTLPGQRHVVDDSDLERRIVAACADLAAAGRLRSFAQLAAVAPDRTSIAALPARERALAGPDLYDLVAPSVCIVGHYYLCDECEHWHFDGASGFWIHADGLAATCAHVLPADPSMRDARLVVADLDGDVWPVEAVVRHDPDADVSVLRTAARDRRPLPLRAAVRTGERVYCLSHPDHRFGFFSDGVVARHCLERDPPEAPPRPWLHVTCDFARGSSGAPVLDERGNVVGIAQATTTVVHDEAADPVDTQMVLRAAVPAAALQALLAPPPTEGLPEVPPGGPPGAGGDRPR